MLWWQICFICHIWPLCDTCPSSTPCKALHKDSCWVWSLGHCTGVRTLADDPAHFRPPCSPRTSEVFCRKISPARESSLPSILSCPCKYSPHDETELPTWEALLFLICACLGEHTGMQFQAFYWSSRTSYVFRFTVNIWKSLRTIVTQTS